MLRRTAAAFDAAVTKTAGPITYLQGLAVTSAALHNCVKDSKQAKYGNHSNGVFFAQKPDGQGAWDKVTTIPANIEEIKK